MNVFTKGDRVAISYKHGSLRAEWAKEGLQGEVISTSHDLCRVEFDDIGPMSINQVWLEPAPKKVNVVYRVEGPKGFTECLTEAQVRGLKSAGILFHNETVLYDDQIVKIYQHEPDLYTVADRRSNHVSLKEQFPKDN